MKSKKLFKYFFLVVLFSTLSSCDVLRSLRYGGIPSQSDYKHFPQRVVNNEGPVYNFFKSSKDSHLGTKIGVINRDFNSTNVSLDSFTTLHKTVTFLIIRNDSIVYEKYNKGYTSNSLVSSFSMAKPFVSTLIGIAIDEGKIKSENDFIVDYLSEFKNKTGWEQITIKNLLQHTSGIRFTDSELDPASDNAAFYWGDNLRARMLNLTLECPPNTKFRYSSENTLLLGYIIEKVTGGTISKYLEDKIWKPLGMEAPASWSLDRKDDKAIEKSFCCLQARAIDFAKLGRLYLNGGNWIGNQIVSKKWIEYSTHSDPSGNNKHFYNNNWGIGPLKYGSYFAVGLFGQYLYVYPEKNIIIVRFGDTETSNHPNYWQEVFLQIIDQM
ncbi:MULTISPECIES: serine hydrolase [Flavobacterium]|uniref:Class C beta-lactamase-related serine hydrolase n=1 Tax=Flavobacterium ranwuense TaxID=2541725 RepID=A0ABY2DU83_9FLAO|nr:MULTISPECIES: serine hydrolase [Flavobacterium]RTZ03101.1 class C beta-lactamase-related serine hydrolase [Flavobacterium sp. GSP6]TDE30479.1 class C beta-lactamase-related serine hydrolase [Flavobacterium ranwuense]